MCEVWCTTRSPPCVHVPFKSMCMCVLCSHSLNWSADDGRKAQGCVHMYVTTEGCVYMYVTTEGCVFMYVTTEYVMLQRSSTLSVQYNLFPLSCIGGAAQSTSETPVPNCAARVSPCFPFKSNPPCNFNLAHRVFRFLIEVFFPISDVATYNGAGWKQSSSKQV
jgi:hypothetical protein